MGAFVLTVSAEITYALFNNAVKGKKLKVYGYKKKAMAPMASIPGSGRLYIVFLISHRNENVSRCRRITYAQPATESDHPERGIDQGQPENLHDPVPASAAGKFAAGVFLAADSRGRTGRSALANCALLSCSSFRRGVNFKRVLPPQPAVLRLARLDFDTEHICLDHAAHIAELGANHRERDCHSAAA